MAERFDVLFSGLSEEEAIRLLHVGAETLDNPGIKYIAASRLGACDSRESLVQLIEFTEADTNNLYDKIAKRKAIEALGRRKNHRALPSILKALACGDEPSVVNAADALTRIGAPLSTSERQELIKALEAVTIRSEPSSRPIPAWGWRTTMAPSDAWRITTTPLWQVRHVPTAHDTKEGGMLFSH